MTWDHEYMIFHSKATKIVTFSLLARIILEDAKDDIDEDDVSGRLKTVCDVVGRIGCDVDATGRIMIGCDVFDVVGRLMRWCEVVDVKGRKLIRCDVVVDEVVVDEVIVDEVVVDDIVDDVFTGLCTGW